MIVETVNELWHGFVCWCCAVVALDSVHCVLCVLSVLRVGVVGGGGVCVFVYDS